MDYWLLPAKGADTAAVGTEASRGPNNAAAEAATTSTAKTGTCCKYKQYGMSKYGMSKYGWPKRRKSNGGCGDRAAARRACWCSAFGKCTAESERANRARAPRVRGYGMRSVQIAVPTLRASKGDGEFTLQIPTRGGERSANDHDGLYVHGAGWW